MKIISWNVLGLARSRARRSLTRLLREHKPDIVFLMETNLTDSQMEGLSDDLCFSCCTVGRSKAGGGGLLLLWPLDWKISVLISSLGYSDGVVHTSTSAFHFTCFYGNPATQLRHFSWELLRRISSTVTSGWLVVGDYNEILDVIKRQVFDSDQWGRF